VTEQCTAFGNSTATIGDTVLQRQQPLDPSWATPISGTLTAGILQYPMRDKIGHTLFSHPD
jgi:hypothetical protein